MFSYVGCGIQLINGYDTNKFYIKSEVAGIKCIWCNYTVIKSNYSLKLLNNNPLK